MVRLLPHFDWNNLPPPRDINIVDYEEAHGVIPLLGAYITDVFSKYVNFFQSIYINNQKKYLKNYVFCDINYIKL